MVNQYSEKMSKLSDAELENVLVQRNDWQPEAVETAEKEVYRRKSIRKDISFVPESV